MVDRLAATRFLSVLGSSGTGKSSVVRTGLLNSLELELMAKAGSSWRIADFRPGSDPLSNLAGALLANEEHVTASDRDSLRGFLARGPRAVIEWCRDGNLPAGTNLLLLADQFEELFRYQDYAKREETQALVELLLESAHSSEFPIYVTITMRSEYLGACALLDGLAEMISRGMVLIPRLTREQCRMAIVGPADVCGIRTDQPLVNQLLNDLTSFASWDDTAAPTSSTSRLDGPISCRSCNIRSTACGCVRASAAALAPTAARSCYGSPIMRRSADCAAPSTSTPISCSRNCRIKRRRASSKRCFVALSRGQPSPKRCGGRDRLASWSN